MVRKKNNKCCISKIMPARQNPEKALVEAQECNVRNEARLARPQKMGRICNYSPLGRLEGA
jgi:hypothetical protein